MWDILYLSMYSAAFAIQVVLSVSAVSESEVFELPARKPDYDGVKA